MTPPGNRWEHARTVAYSLFSLCSLFFKIRVFYGNPLVLDACLFLFDDVRLGFFILFVEGDLNKAFSNGNLIRLVGFEVEV